MSLPGDKKTLIHSFLPTLVLLFFLGGVGAFLGLRGYEGYWPGCAALVVFYALVFIAGSLVSRRKMQGGVGGMMLAGRSLPLWLAVFTMSATWVGGGYINGSAEAAYISGLMWVQAPVGYALSLIFGGMFFASRMRRHNFKSMLDPIHQRFGRRMSAVLFIPALAGEIFWTAAILTALGTTFGTVLGLDFQAGILISAVIAVGYTTLGGLWAVAVTDVIQQALIVLGLGLAVPAVLSRAGGFSEIWAGYTELRGASAILSFPHPGNSAWGAAAWEWWDLMLLLIFGGIPWQVYFQRVLAARSPAVARNLSLFAGLVCMAAAVPSVLIGMAGSVFPWESAGVDSVDPALILPYALRYLTPPVISVIGLGAIAAAVMSSVDSSVLSAASLATWNVYKPLIKPYADDKRLGRVIKKNIVIIGTAATLLALRVESVYSLWALCSDFVYCLLFPQLLAALYFRKANRWGSIAGFATSFILRFGGGEPVFGIPRLIPYPVIDGSTGMVMPFKTLSMLGGLLVLILVSLATYRQCQPNSLEVMEE